MITLIQRSRLRQLLDIEQKAMVYLVSLKAAKIAENAANKTFADAMKDLLLARDRIAQLERRIKLGTNQQNPGTWIVQNGAEKNATP
jgi:hypothetical protein